MESEADLALYFVVHTPRAERDVTVRPPTRLRELADVSLAQQRPARWIKTWSPDLHDDRIFTLWEAGSAEDVRVTMQEFGFLDDLDAKPMRVREWGPADVLAEES